MPLSDYKRKTNFLEAHQELFTKNQIDWWVRHRESNGLAEANALVKAANQWYFHEDNFAAWFSGQR